MMVAALDHLFEQISPEQGMRSFGVKGMSVSEILSVWEAHLLLSADRADRHVPTEEEWVAVLERMISGVGPDNH